MEGPQTTINKKDFYSGASQVPPSEGYREAFTLHLADTALILAQRNSEWCAHGPILEQDIAITNISLDLLGQSRNFYQYAALLINGSINQQSTNQTNAQASEDSLAYLRTEREFKNLLITELPNGDWAQTILRQFFFSVYQYHLYEQLQKSNDTQLVAIAAKSIKETTYHVKWTSEWVIRLGDGTAESHQRMLNAIENIWPYTGEFFMPAAYESAADINLDMDVLKNQWTQKVKGIFDEATLAIPEAVFMQAGGKTGNHTEHLGFILAEMQHLQRTYPGAEW